MTVRIRLALGGEVARQTAIVDEQVGRWRMESRGMEMRRLCSHQRRHWCWDWREFDAGMTQWRIWDQSRHPETSCRVDPH